MAKTSKKSRKKAGFSSTKHALKDFAEELAKRKNLMKGVIHLHLGGADGGEWRIKCTSQSATVVRGLGKELPLVDIYGPAKAVQDFLCGKDTGMQAYDEGVVNVIPGPPLLEDRDATIGPFAAGEQELRGLVQSFHMHGRRVGDYRVSTWEIGPAPGNTTRCLLGANTPGVSTSPERAATNLELYHAMLNITSWAPLINSLIAAHFNHREVILNVYRLVFQGNVSFHIRDVDIR